MREQFKTPQYPDLKNPQRDIYKFIYGTILHQAVRPMLSLRLSPSNGLLFVSETYRLNLELIGGESSVRSFGWHTHRHRVITPKVILLELNINIDTATEQEQGIVGVQASHRSAILIFLDKTTKSVGIGCTRCGIGQPFPNYSTLDIDRRNSLMSFSNLLKFWERLHINLYFGKERYENYCPAMDLHRIHYGKLCNLRRIFYQYVNCSNFDNCASNYYSQFQLLRAQKTVDMPSEVLPFGLEQLDYTFQVISPKILFLDVKLNAFLSPFSYVVWLWTLAAAFIIFLWLTCIEHQQLSQALLWHLSNFCEQNNILIRNMKRLSKFVMLVFIFCTLTLRNCYTSSLYSFLASEKQPIGIPQSMEEMVGKHDFDTISHSRFHEEVHSMFWRDFTYLPTRLRELYINICMKSYFVIERSELQTLNNLSNEMATNIRRNGAHSFTNSTSVEDLIRSPWVASTKQFHNFGVICKGSCENIWKLAFVGKRNWHRIVPKQSPFLSSAHFWTRDHIGIKTFSFLKFLGSFVESGMYDFTFKRYKMLEEYYSMKFAESVLQLGMSKGNIFSYVFLNDGKDVQNNEVLSTKLTAFYGTFFIYLFVIFAAFISLGLEVLKHKLLQHLEC
ncbi:unnamed protein product [Orchesella dallaii]|uniref:Uncharacterized protein n=1 Tax=Orchesella dallaii TaxID=48710 RepID=A0ABP1RLT5_9HEXA